MQCLCLVQGNAENWDQTLACACISRALGHCVQHAMVAQRKELQQNQALSTSSQEHSTRTPHSSILSPDPALFFNPYIQGCRLHVRHLELASVSNHGHRDLQGAFGSEPDPTLKALGLRSLRACRPAKVLAFKHRSLHRVTLKVLERGSLRASYGICRISIARFPAEHYQSSQQFRVSTFCLSFE